MSLAVAFALYSDELTDPDTLGDPAFVTNLITNYPVVATSVVATAIALIGVPFLTAKFSKAKIREALGFRPAPWQAFVLAPIGILALGPTSDALVRAMKAIAPNASLGALESISQIVEAHPFWMLWPIIALCPGFSEEIFFRGLIQRAAGFGWRAITISAVSFSFFHMDPHHVAGVLPLGFYLAWLGARTGSTWVPILAHVVNNSMALLAGKLAGPGIEDVELPLWVLPIGWTIAAACIYGIWRVTQDQERWLGPAAGPHATQLDVPAVSPDWRIVRVMGAQEDVLGYVREAMLQLPDVVGRFQPGPSYDDFVAHLQALEGPSDPESQQLAKDALAGFVLEDMATGDRLEAVDFRISLTAGEVVFRPKAS